MLVDLQESLRALPADIDVEIAVNAITKLIDNTLYLGRHCTQLPPAVIRGVLARNHPSTTHIFLKLAVDEEDDRELVTRWQRALAALRDLDTTYAWGSKQYRAKIRGLATDPHVLAAIQGTVANSSRVELHMLAVLAADGSEASVDALIPHLDVDTTSVAPRLEILTKLRTHAARTPFLDALFCEIDSALANRSATSPALAVGPLLGIGAPDPLWFTVSFIGKQGDYAFNGNLTVDSRKVCWYSVALIGDSSTTARNYTAFNSSGEVTDSLGLGTCEIAELPAWLERSAIKLKLVARRGRLWRVGRVRTHLRGAHRDRITAWLALDA